MKTVESNWSRRAMLKCGSGALLGGLTAFTASDALAQAAGRVNSRISDVQTMTIKGSDRTYTYVRVLTNDGHSGIAEAYGSPGVAVAEQIQALKSTLVGRNPLEIDQIYTRIGMESESLSGSRTDGSAHNLPRAVSGVEMALWDLAGHLLDVPTSYLLGGTFRERVRVYNHSYPKDPWSKASCDEWAAQVKADPAGFTAHKVSVRGIRGALARKNGDVVDPGTDPGNRRISTQEMIALGKAFENIRVAIGWDHDLMVHGAWNFDLPSALQLAEAVAPVKPVFFEDPLPVAYSNSWQTLIERSPVPILMGENLFRREDFAPFILNKGCHMINPDLRNSGGFLETKRTADLAGLFGMPTCTHNTGTQLHVYQVCQWASTIRDFLMCETITGKGGWMDEILVLDRPYIEKGFVHVSKRAGTGAVLNRAVVEPRLVPGQKWWG
ncbi:mandelate racemase/muconate lactonizing enzyme family protein [soil metagenome]